MKDPKNPNRCPWVDLTKPDYVEYHDKEWGRPERDSRAMWECLMLEGFQAGLSWQTILRRREGFRRAFKEFDPVKVAKFTEKDIERLMQDEGIIRARAKIVATIEGAKIFLAMEKNGEDFGKYYWKLAGGKPTVNRTGHVPAPSTASQTAWALLGLMAAGEVDSQAVARGIDWLAANQDSDGLWGQEYYTGGGFPRVFYLRYHGYPKYFPLWAIARYRNLKRSNTKRVTVGM